MIKQTFLEARQLGSKTSLSNTNGDYEVILNEPMIIKEGDTLTLESAFIDTIDITDNHVVVEEDTELTISYYMYADMGGYGMNDFNMKNTDNKRVLVSPNLTRYYNINPYVSPILHGQAKGVLSKWVLGSEIAADYRKATKLNLFAADLTKPHWGGGTITIEFNGIDGRQRITEKVPKYDTASNVSFSLSLSAPPEQHQGVHEFFYETAYPGVIITSDNNLNIRSVVIDESEAIDPTLNILIPIIRKKKINIPKGRYSPEDMVERLNLETSAIPDVTGGTENITRAGQFNLTASDVNDNLGNHFLTNCGLLRMGDLSVVDHPAVAPVTTEDLFKDRLFLVYNNGESYQVFTKGLGRDETTPPTLPLPTDYTPDSFYMLGSSQGIQFGYDSSTSKISIIAAHSPFVSPAGPLPATKTDPLTAIPSTLGFSLQLTMTPSWNQAASPAPGLWQLLQYEQNFTSRPPLPVETPPRYIPSMNNHFQTDMGGVLIQNLEPASFWEGLGFNLSSLVVNPSFDLEDTKNLTGNNIDYDNNLNPTPMTNNFFETTTPPPNTVLPSFNLEIGKNYTGNFVDLASFRNLGSIDRYINDKEDYNGTITTDAFDATTPLIVGWGVNNYIQTTTDTFKIEADNRVVGGDLDSAYYFVEVNLQQNKLLDSNGGEKRTIAGIINRYYSVSSYTSTEGGFSYIHRGEPMVINTLHVRILMPDGSQVQRLGPDNSVFLKLTSEEPLPTPPSPINQKQKKN
jgi:hypothetical protein